MTKAEQKRREALSNQIAKSLSHKLADFENMFIQDNIDRTFNMLQDQLKFNKEVLQEENVAYRKRSNAEYRVSYLESQLSRPALITMNAANEAKEHYDKKFAKIVEKLTDEFTTSFIKVKFIDQMTNKGFDFLITNEKDQREVHARVIWVNGVEKISHFRFITTGRAMK